jgi:hypothetical protein
MHLPRSAVTHWLHISLLLLLPLLRCNYGCITLSL